MIRRRHQNSGRQNGGKRSPAHLQHVRGFACLVEGRGDPCEGKIEAAHVDYAPGKGMGMKVPDAYTVPLCNRHHREQTLTSWSRFEARYGVDALEIARQIARQSPSIIRAAHAAGVQFDAAEADQ